MPPMPLIMPPTLTVVIKTKATARRMISSMISCPSVSSVSGEDVKALRIRAALPTSSFRSRACAVNPQDGKDLTGWGRA